MAIQHCPVTGKPVARNRVFALHGSDTKARSILNQLLTGEMIANDLRNHPDVSAPEAFERALAKAKRDAAGKVGFRVTHPSRYF